MGEPKFTPGPWSPMWQNSRSVAYGRMDRWEIPVTVGKWPGGGNAICTVYMGGPGATLSGKEGVEANARLIAAGPDLLASVTSLVDAMQRYQVEVEGDAPQEHIDMMDQARAAIAKALGGQEASAPYGDHATEGWATVNREAGR